MPDIAEAREKDRQAPTSVQQLINRSDASASN